MDKGVTACLLGLKPLQAGLLLIANNDEWAAIFVLRVNSVASWGSLHYYRLFSKKRGDLVV